MSEFLIPKKLHQVWVGDKPMPPDYRRFAETWRIAHPSWDFVLHATHPEHHRGGSWSDVQRLDLSSLHMADLIDVLPNFCMMKHYPAIVADIARAEIVLRHGGVYVDTDVLCLKAIDELVLPQSLCVADEWTGPQGQISGNFLFGARKGHPALWSLLNTIWHNCRMIFARALNQKGGSVMPLHYNGDAGTISAVDHTGPIPMMAVFGRYADCVRFPFPLFSHWNPVFDCGDWKRVVWPKNAYAVHLFHATWAQRTSRSQPIDSSEGTSVSWHIYPEAFKTP